MIDADVRRVFVNEGKVPAPQDLLHCRFDTYTRNRVKCREHKTEIEIGVGVKGKNKTAYQELCPQCLAQCLELEGAKVYAAPAAMPYGDSNPCDEVSQKRADWWYGMMYRYNRQAEPYIFRGFEAVLFYDTQRITAIVVCNDDNYLNPDGYGEKI